MEKLVYGVINWTRTQKFAKEILDLLEKENHNLTILEMIMAFEMVKDSKEAIQYNRREIRGL